MFGIYPRPSWADRWWPLQHSVSQKQSPAGFRVSLRQFVDSIPGPNQPHPSLLVVSVSSSSTDLFSNFLRFPSSSLFPLLPSFFLFSPPTVSPLSSSLVFPPHPRPSPPPQSHHPPFPLSLPDALLPPPRARLHGGGGTFPWRPRVAARHVHRDAVRRPDVVVDATRAVRSRPASRRGPRRQVARRPRGSDDAGVNRVRQLPRESQPDWPTSPFLCHFTLKSAHYNYSIATHK